MVGDDAPSTADSTREVFKWVPEAGWVMVLRLFVTEEKYRDASGKETDIIKPISEQRLEEFKNKMAVVLEVGADDPRTGEVGKWTEGQDVLIEPSVFREVMLGGGKTVWLGPFVGIIAHVEKVKEKVKATEPDPDAN
jgi:hypothetical protein